MTDPVLVYVGQPMECVFLKTLLEGNGVETYYPIDRVDGYPGEIYVDRSSLPDALPLVEDFKQNGHKSSV